MGDRRGFVATEIRIEAVPPRPELAHRHVGHTAQGHVGRGIHVVRFDRQTESVASAEPFQMLGVIFDHKLLRREPEIPEESLGNLQAFDDPARHGGQIRQRIVAATALELAAESGGPILGAHLPAINVEHGPAAGALDRPRPNGANKFAYEGVEMRVQRGRVELVALQSQPRLRRGASVGTGVPASKTEDCPGAGGNVPGQSTVVRKAVGEIDHAVPRYDRIGREFRMSCRSGQVGFHAWSRCVGCPHVKCLLVHIR